MMRRIVAAAFFVCALLGACGAAFAASNSASADVVLRALRDEMERSKAKLKLDNVDAPYFIEYRVTDVDSLEASATFGALHSQQRTRARLLRVVVRIGDYTQDSFYGSGEGTADLVPVDGDEFATRHRVWLATDRAYKAAGEALSAKRAALRRLKVDEPVDDFAKASPVELIEPVARLSDEATPWLNLLEEASGKYRTDSLLESWDASLRFTAQNRYLVNSEGTVSRTGQTYYSVYLSGSTQAPDGMLLQRSHGDSGNEMKELPTREKYLAKADELLDTLKQLRAAPVVDEEYRGPVLMANDAAATVVNDLIEPNLLGKKPRLGENARTTGHWSSSYKSRVLPDFVNIYDDPTINVVGGERLFGNYRLDDEGVKGERVSLVAKGQLVSYLLGRQPIRDFPASNGHARGPAFASPEPQPGNMVLESTDPHSDAELKKKLIELCKQRDLPFGFYVGTMGPRLTPRLLYRVWVKDGREELVRGGVFGDLDVRSLRNDLVAVGTKPAAEERFEPIAYSVASPALLFDELQVKRSQEQKQKLPEYPAPPLTSQKGQ
jgi:predicted Zn-dependent protease